MDTSCPPADDDACAAADAGFWHCSASVAGGIYKFVDTRSLEPRRTPPLRLSAQTPFH